MHQHKKTILITSLLIFLPFIESLLPGFFALTWHSPRKMYAWSENFRIVKMIMVCLGIIYFTLALSSNELSQMRTWSRVFFTLVAYILAFLQLPFLFLGLIVGISSDKQLNYVHKELTVGNKNFYVYTADPGAMGTAYHHLHLKCPKLLNRYELTFIKRFDWIHGLELEEKDKQLLLKGSSHEELIDTDEYHCE